MTNEERDKAIRILQWLHDNTYLFRSTEEDVKYATKLAIQELSQESKVEKIIKMRDATPEEQEAIDKYIKSISKPTGVSWGQKCTTCKYYTDADEIHGYTPCGNCGIEQSNYEPKDKAQADGEHISRQAVMDCYKKWQLYMATRLHEFEKELSALPPVTPQPKYGVWVEIDDEPHEVWECYHCGFVIDGSGCIEPYEYRDTYKFCPNCGAKMQEVEE